MAFTQTQLDAIDAAIASGELTIEYNGERTTYRSIDELMKARAIVAGGLAQYDRQTYATFTRD